MQRKKLGILTTTLILLFILCSCGTKEVVEKNVQINYGGSVYQGRYSGTMVDSKPSGEGEYVDASGWKYTGEFEDASFSGPASVEEYPCSVFVNNSSCFGVYSGDTLGLSPNGTGVFAAIDGWSYAGTFIDGEIKENGTITTYPYTVSLGQTDIIGTYDGEAIDGVPQGEGLFKATDNEELFFEGDFADGRISTGDIHAMPMVIEYQEIQYAGLYDGYIVEGKPSGEGFFKAYDGEIDFEYTGNWLDGRFGGDGYLYAENYHFVFAKHEKYGVYQGETTNGMPDGEGAFSTFNSKGEAWEYQGDFFEGHMTGYGSLAFESGFVEKGDFIDGEFMPNLVDGLSTLGQNEPSFELAEVTKKFINEYEELFVGDGFDGDVGIEKYNEMVSKYNAVTNSDLTYNMYVRKPQDFNDKLIHLEECTATQVWIYDFFNTDMDEVEFIVKDRDKNIYYVYYIDGASRAEELPLYEGTKLDLWALPLASSSYSNVSGGITNCVVLLAGLMAFYR